MNNNRLPASTWQPESDRKQGNYSWCMALFSTVYIQGGGGEAAAAGAWIL